MKKNKMLFTGLLLLLFATYSCEKEEIQPEATPISSEILKKVNPVFLEHDLSAYQIKPIWDSFITFDNADAVEVNFSIDKKFYVPLSKNGKIRGRQRLLLTFEKGKVIETILEYIPSDGFMGNIKDINSGNFKSKQFDGEITFKHPNDNYSIVWVLSKGVVIKKLKRTELISKQKKTHKTAELIEVCSYREIEYEICAGSGEAESCVTHTKDVYDCVWIDYTDPETPPEVDPYDCAVNDSWPWCQDGGGGDGEGTPGTAIIINDQALKNNPCLNEVYSKLGEASGFDYYLKNFDGSNSVANLKFAIGTLGGNTYGETSPPNNYLITITLDADKLTNTPSLFVADIFIHEIIHAEMFRKMMEAAESGNIDPTTMTTQQQIDYVESLRNNFPGLYDYYMRYEYNVPSGQEPSNAMHELMAQHYISTIVSALKQYDNTQTEDVYKAIAWFGLKGTGTEDKNTGLYSNSTKAWENLSTQERLNLIQILKDFKNNAPKCQN